ncbi:hypothetical protein LDENG_00134520 [Lucifuga dentata]|nr:hypothetical protein LDENG_00134520 [Lucifuga dentata]
MMMSASYDDALWKRKWRTDMYLCQIDVLACDNRLLLQQHNSNSTHFSSDEHTCPDGEINAHTSDVSLCM